MFRPGPQGHDAVRYHLDHLVSALHALKIEIRRHIHAGADAQGCFVTPAADYGNAAVTAVRVEDCVAYGGTVVPAIANICAVLKGQQTRINLMVVFVGHGQRAIRLGGDAQMVILQAALTHQQIGLHRVTGRDAGFAGAHAERGIPQRRNAQRQADTHHIDLVILGEAPVESAGADLAQFLCQALIGQFPPIRSKNAESNFCLPVGHFIEQRPRWRQFQVKIDHFVQIDGQWVEHANAQLVLAHIPYHAGDQALRRFLADLLRDLLALVEAIEHVRVDRIDRTAAD